jgi:hypothetical protein
MSSARLEASRGEHDRAAQLSESAGDRLGQVAVPAGQDRRPSAQIERPEQGPRMLWPN